MKQKKYVFLKCVKCMHIITRLNIFFTSLISVVYNFYATVFYANSIGYIRCFGKKTFLCGENRKEIYTQNFNFSSFGLRFDIIHSFINVYTLTVNVVP